ncbi:MAG: helix-turn-helix domain-containing protein [Balneolaceae bacterium]|nr:helix-turn-helix domain-containing protein [Balneolaceae bacterium]
MDTLKYKVIKSDVQYIEYANRLEELVTKGLESQEAIDEYELLYLLIRTWDNEHRLAPELDPIELIKSLMKDHELSQNDLANIAGVGKSYISEISNYKKRMSKKVIRNIAEHFKIQQEALNRHYRLEGEGKFEERGSRTSKIFDFKTGELVSYTESTRGFEVQPDDPNYSIAK